VGPGAQEGLRDTRADAARAASYHYSGITGWLVDWLHGAMLGSRPSKR
jgi:hypothetical protein